MGPPHGEMYRRSLQKPLQVALRPQLVRRHQPLKHADPRIERHHERIVIERICLVDSGGPSSMSSRVKSLIGWKGRGPRREPRDRCRSVGLSSGRLRFCAVQCPSGQKQRRRSRVCIWRSSETHTLSRWGHIWRFCSYGWLRCLPTSEPVPPKLRASPPLRDDIIFSCRLERVSGKASSTSPSEISFSVVLSGMSSGMLNGMMLLTVPGSTFSCTNSPSCREAISRPNSAQNEARIGMRRTIGELNSWPVLCAVSVYHSPRMISGLDASMYSSLYSYTAIRLYVISWWQIWQRCCTASGSSSTVSIRRTVNDTRRRSFSIPMTACSRAASRGPSAGPSSPSESESLESSSGRLIEERIVFRGSLVMLSTIEATTLSFKREYKSELVKRSRSSCTRLVVRAFFGVPTGRDPTGAVPSSSSSVVDQYRAPVVQQTLVLVGRVAHQRPVGEIGPLAQRRQHKVLHLVGELRREHVKRERLQYLAAERVARFRIDQLQRAQQHLEQCVGDRLLFDQLPNDAEVAPLDQMAVDGDEVALDVLLAAATGRWDVFRDPISVLTAAMLIEKDDPLAVVLQILPTVPYRPVRPPVLVELVPLPLLGVLALDKAPHGGLYHDRTALVAAGLLALLPLLLRLPDRRQPRSCVSSPEHVLPHVLLLYRIYFLRFAVKQRLRGLRFRCLRAPATCLLLLLLFFMAMRFVARFGARLLPLSVCMTMPVCLDEHVAAGKLSTTLATLAHPRRRAPVAPERVQKQRHSAVVVRIVQMVEQTAGAADAAAAPVRDQLDHVLVPDVGQPAHGGLRLLRWRRLLLHLQIDRFAFLLLLLLLLLHLLLGLGAFARRFHRRVQHFYRHECHRIVGRWWVRQLVTLANATRLVALARVPFTLQQHFLLLFCFFHFRRLLPIRNEWKGNDRYGALVFRALATDRTDRHFRVAFQELGERKLLRLGGRSRVLAGGIRLPPIILLHGRGRRGPKDRGGQGVGGRLRLL
uniref:Uncharacterized protein n=1 Tax=Anopheles coluzzii TaxID=1518534 RepID=A0A8W7Q274_ANOCL